jgi:hypothetical protein
MPSRKLRVIQNVVTGNYPYLRLEAADSYDALRADTLRLSGVDFLKILGDCFRSKSFVKNSPGSVTTSLHKCGVAYDYNQGEPNLVLVRETAPQDRVWWRTYIRIKDVSLQKPSEFVSKINVRTENAGQYTGWALDFTALAERHGWERIRAHIGWEKKGNWTKREFWHFQYKKLADKGYTALMADLYAPTTEEDNTALLPTLKISSPMTRGENVLTAQRRLKHHGAVLAADGYFGENTRSSVRTFQKRVGLPQTGIIDAATWTALLKG